MNCIIAFVDVYQQNIDFLSKLKSLPSNQNHGRQHIFKKNSTIQQNSPEQLNPFPLNPAKHSHSKEPAVLIQAALSEHMCVVSLHSLMSDKEA